MQFFSFTEKYLTIPNLHEYDCHFSPKLISWMDSSQFVQKRHEKLSCDVCWKMAFISTRIYMICLSLSIGILILTTKYRQQINVQMITSPSLGTFERLCKLYPDTLICPCQQITIPYSEAMTLTPKFHQIQFSSSKIDCLQTLLNFQICSSDFIGDRWIRLLYGYGFDANGYTHHIDRCSATIFRFWVGSVFYRNISSLIWKRYSRCHHWSIST